MTPPDERQNLKRIICDFITDAMLPSQVAQRVAESLESKPDPRVMAQAILGAKDKVRLIMEQIPHLNSQAFLLRIPGPAFLEFVLFSEYLLQNSLQGEKATLRYARKAREKSGQTMTRCLNRLGFFAPRTWRPIARRSTTVMKTAPRCGGKWWRASPSSQRRNFLSLDLKQSRRQKTILLRTSLTKVAARLLLAARDGLPADWHLLGRSVGRVERDLKWLFNRIEDLEQLEQVADLYLDEKILEAQVKSTYVFAKTHSLGQFQDARLEGKLAKMLGALGPVEKP